ncbi:MAG: PEP-CTERM sorting domain-containing protein [Burkholderiaceae bacterium]|nr:PEP-CTERM sorting domain-containing protein [Burkholderiaceae bacterium]
MKRRLLFLLGLTAALPAMADVIYRWHTVSASPELPAFDAVLHITDDAYRRGNAFLDFNGCAGMACALRATEVGIVYMGYSFALGSHGHQPPLVMGVYDKFDLQFDRVGGLTGSIRFNTTEVELAMSGHSLWSVDLLRGDPYIGTPCGGPTYCSGASGYFQADRLPLPEPASLGLMTAGMAALAAMRRKFRPARQPAPDLALQSALRHGPDVTA